MDSGLLRWLSLNKTPQHRILTIEMNIKNNGFLSNMFKVKFISNVPMSVTCTWCWHSNTHQRWVDWSACTCILYSKIYQDRENIKGIGRTVSLSLNFWRYNKSLWILFRPYIKVINLLKSSIVSNICPYMILSLPILRRGQWYCYCLITLKQFFFTL